MKKKNKTLIIKTGYSETLDKNISYKSSLGDVLRTTVVLHLLKDSHVTWLVDEHAFKLLYGNPFIDRILIYNLTSTLQLQRERFDTVINFEKVPGLCSLADSIKAWRRFGFRFDEEKGEALAYDHSDEVHSITQNIDKKRFHKKNWQEALYEMMGDVWNGEEYTTILKVEINDEYILGYKPKTEVKHDIGLNWAVGKTYPTKAWPKSNWGTLAKKLDSHYSYSWQEGLECIYQYIDWINSCRLLITSDSLGVHIGLALKKKIIVLYGATHPGEVYLYGRGKILLPKSDFDCMPCLSPECNNERFCMNFISDEMVFDQVESMLAHDMAMSAF